jgi:hypothetical protein
LMEKPQKSRFYWIIPISYYSQASFHTEASVRYIWSSTQHVALI